MMETHRYLWALVVLVCLGGSYVLTAPADLPVGEAGPEIVVAEQGNKACELDVLMNSTYQCTHPVDVNAIAAETENDLPLCDCPAFSDCTAIKIGEIYKCKSKELVMEEQADLLMFNMNMVGDDAE